MLAASPPVCRTIATGGVVPTSAQLDAALVFTLVHAEACHLCEDARAVLAEFAANYPIAVECVSASEPAGQELVTRHRAPMFPLVLVDGAFFSYGRLSRGKVRALLQARCSDPVVGATR
jgi:hypothetical protein